MLNTVQLIVFCILAGGNFLFFIVTSAIFYRRDIKPDRSQHSQILSLVTACACGLLSSLLLLWIPFREDTPSFLCLWLPYFLIALVLGTIGLRALRLILLLRASTSKLRSCGLLFGTLDLLSCLTIKEVPQASRRQRENSTDKLLTFLFLLILLVSIIGIALIQHQSELPLSLVKTSHTFTWEFYPLYLGILCYLVFFCPTLIFKLWSLNHAYSIRRDFLFSTIVVALGLGIDFFYRFYHKNPSPYLVLLPVLVILLIHFISICLPIFFSLKWTDRPPAQFDYIQVKEEFCMKLLDWSFFENFKQTAMECLCVENVLFLEAYQDLKKLSLVAISNSESEIITGKAAGNSKVSWSMNSSVTPPSPAHISYTSPQIATCLSYPHSSVKQTITPANISIARTIESLTEQIMVPSDLAPYYQRFYEKFFLPGSLLEINIPCEMVSNLRDAVGGKNYTLTMFDQAKEEVLDSLYYEVYLRFPMNLHHAA
ncbi:hypothetical protein K7432_000117 [Basidiobolus ranarum]|uniref:RGS domain-containing protein n=1 Tax=Basidiobolus ranarum TaxID=34480 RepID=A0ABR2X538_9FUNG